MASKSRALTVRESRWQDVAPANAYACPSPLPSPPGPPPRPAPRPHNVCTKFSYSGEATHTSCRSSVKVISSEIAGASLRVGLPWYTHLYTIPFLCFYPLLGYAYYVKYDEWLQSEEWTFLACVSLGLGHALSFLFTRWNTGAKAWITTRKVCNDLLLCHLSHMFCANSTDGGAWGAAQCSTVVSYPSSVATFTFLSVH